MGIISTKPSFQSNTYIYASEVNSEFSDVIDDLADLDTREALLLLLNGTRPMTGTLDMALNVIKNITTLVAKTSADDGFIMFAGELIPVTTFLVSGMDNSINPGTIRASVPNAAKSAGLVAFKIAGVTDTPKVECAYGIITDLIEEKTGAAGVTIDSCLIKDGGLTLPSTKNILCSVDNGYIDFAGGSQYSPYVRAYGKNHVTWPGCISLSVPNTVGNAYSEAILIGKGDSPIVYFGGSIQTDIIDEINSGVGVTIDSCLIKDGSVADSLKLGGTLAASYMLKSLYDANTMLYATSDNTPVALPIAASRFVGRKAAGNISAMTVAEAKTLLAIGIADISNIPGTIATILTDHDKAAHDALALDHGSLSGLGDDDHTQYTLKSLFDANTILKADSDNTPLALTIDEQRILGRITAGSITGLTAAQVRTLCDVPSTSEVVLDTLFDAYTILYADIDNTPAALTVAASRFVGRKVAGGIAAMTVAEAKTLLAIAIADISDIPGTIASILTDHDKTVHDALGIAPASHGADKHTDRTRSVFVGAGTAILSGATQDLTLTPYGSVLLNNAGEYALFNLKVPDDYASAPKLKIVAVYLGVAGQVDTNAAWNGHDEDYVGNTETQNDVAITAGGANRTAYIDCGYAFANLAAGDTIGFKILFDTTNQYILGVMFEYTADM